MSARLIEVIEVQEAECHGAEDDSIRIVRRYYSKDGVLLAEGVGLGASKAVLGLPRRCPNCGGTLVPSFGINVDDTGRRSAVIEPGIVRCYDCHKSFADAELKPPSFPSNRVRREGDIG